MNWRSRPFCVRSGPARLWRGRAHGEPVPGREIPLGRLVIPIHGSPKPPPTCVLTEQALAASRDLLLS